MPGVGSIETPPGLHGLRSAALSAWIRNRSAPYIHYYNRAAVLVCTVSGRPVRRRLRYIRICRSGNVGGRMGQILGKATVKPCKRFWCLAGIICMDSTKHVVNACMGMYCSRAKRKALHRVDARQKKSPAIADRVECFLFGCFEQGREKPEEKQDTGKNHACTSILAPKLVKVRRCEIVTGSSPAVLIP